MWVEKENVFPRKHLCLGSLSKELSPSNAQLCSQKQPGEEKKPTEVLMFRVGDGKGNRSGCQDF